ncbi:OPT oligopeptide transporter protein-domain-containing protein [Boletus coccyginus]|nr:OPT oligopeptide transporter protein-domain-containing protein [Boletus coccyginus]
MPIEYAFPSPGHPLRHLYTSSDEYFAEVETIGSEDKDSESVVHVRALSFVSESSGSVYSSDFDDPNLDPNRTCEFDDDSPYPEVRAAVANTDDPSIPVMTLRTWVLGLAWSVIIPGVNQFLFFRYPSVPVVGIIMATVGSQSAYATDIIAVQRFYYNQRYSFAYQWFLVVSTQLIGFSAGGIARRFLVAPSSMIWPNTLVTCALFNTLHSQQYAGSGRLGGMSRERFFLYAFTASFLWYFVPGYLFQALSYFSWVTWIWPENAVIAQLFGYVHGMGMSVVTLDWSQIAYIGSPLATPWWAAANIIFGFVFTNTWNSLYMPIQSRHVFDNAMQPYNITRVLTSEAMFDTEAYGLYSPLFMSTSFAVSYGYQIIQQSRRSLREAPDIHARLMSVYSQVPDWWYLVLFLVMFASFTYVIPCGMIQAITNQQVGLHYALPGRPLANMLFKTYGYITMAQALTFTADFKLGHYMKIPPRTMFWCQIICTVIAGTTQLLVQWWMFDKDICSVTQKDGFTCPSTQVFATASVIWGVVGPERLFSPGRSIQASLTYLFVAGAIAPIIPWLLMKKWPNTPVIFTGTSSIPPATAINFVPWVIVGFIFQFFIRRRFFTWWTKYNYVLSAALDGGLALSVIGLNTIQHWWGNQVFLTNYDGRGVPVRHLAPGETLG